MSGGREAAHVGDAAEQTDGVPKRVVIAVHLPVDLLDGGGQGIDLTEVQAQQKAVAVDRGEKVVRMGGIRKTKNSWPRDAP